MRIEAQKESFQGGAEKLMELARRAPVGIRLTDAAGREVLLNEQWCEISGISGRDARNMGWLRSVHPDDRDRLVREIERSRNERTGFSLEHRFLKPDGTITWVISNGTPLSDPQGRPRGSLGAMLDVGSHREIEDHLIRATLHAREIIRFRIRSMSGFTPELQARVDRIPGLNELLREETANARDSMHVRMMYDSSLRLTQTVDRILELSRIESNEIRPDVSYTPLANVVLSVTSQFAGTARTGGVEFQVDVTDKEIAALIDAGMLRNALGHILDNALSFTPSGRVRVSLRERGEGNDAHAEIEVSDTGIGIPGEFHQAVFEPFRQVSLAPARMSQGTGLGLTLARRIVVGMNGTLGLESDPGKGTKVILRFAKAAPPGLKV